MELHRTCDSTNQIYTLPRADQILVNKTLKPVSTFFKLEGLLQVISVFGMRHENNDALVQVC